MHGLGFVIFPNDPKANADAYDVFTDAIEQEVERIRKNQNETAYCTSVTAKQRKNKEKAYNVSFEYVVC